MRLRLCLLMLVLFTLLTLPMHAQLVIGFHTGNTSATSGGTFSYDGLGGPLIGANIPLALLTSTNTPANTSGHFVVTTATLSFTTGNLSSYDAVNGIYNFGAGGSLTLTGGVPVIPIPDGTVLESGTTVSAQYRTTGELTIVVGNDTKNPLLLTFFGIPSGTPFQFNASAFASLDTGSYGGAGFTADGTFSTDVDNDLLSVALTCPSGSGTVGAPYSSALLASGGLPPYTFSVTAGMLPTGLTLNSDGTITGTPQSAGPFSFTAQTADSVTNKAIYDTATSSCSIGISTAPTANCVAINAVQGSPITPVTMTASGGTGSGYTFSSSDLTSQTGLTISSTGTISGTPTATGTFTYHVTITDSGGHTGTINCSLTVNPAPNAVCVTINTVQGISITPVTLLGTGGSGPPYTFSSVDLTSLTGLTISSSGTISGTPNVNGTFTYHVIIKDSAGNTGTFSCSVTVAPPPIAANCVVINAVQNVAITPVTMTATGGTGAGYTFSATGLPNGLTMSTSGTVSGTPTVSGTFNYTVTVTDSGGNTGTFHCSVTVAPPPIVANCLVINAVQNVAVTPVTMTATGGTGTGYTFSATGLPNGLTMSSSGTVSGTPTVSGTFNYTVTVTDSGGNTGTFHCSVMVAPPPIAANCVVINAVQNVAITPVTMTATGGTGTGYTFSATGLPNGLTMSSSGTVSGTPTVSGTFNYTVTVTDSGGNTGTFHCSVMVAPPPIAANCVVINAVQNVAITPVTMTATGGTGTGYTFSATGLPNGLTMSSSGTVSGTPTVSGAFNYTVTVTDSGGNTGTFHCSVTVAPVISANCVSITANQGMAIPAVTMTASGGAGGPYIYTATGLPSGVTMSTSGTISGTPTVSGTFTYTVTITDRAGNTGTFQCSVTVGPLPCSLSLAPLLYNVSESGSNANEIVWFNSHLAKLAGTIPTSTFSIYVQNGQISFGTQTLTVPNAVITFSSTATSASTSFDTINNVWLTTIPLSQAGNVDEIFMAGLAYPLPAGFAQNVSNVTWSATLYSTASALRISWQYGASNWLTINNGTNFPGYSGGVGAPDYNGMTVNPAHNAGPYSSDHAGAPEFTGRSNVLTGGGSGGGGSNWTGSWSSTPPASDFVCSAGPVISGDTATIGFWHNKNGQALIDSLNGGSTSTNLGNWLATQFPYINGANSSNNMTGKTNAQVAALFLTFFGVSGQKTQAQILAGALASYVTDTTLAGNAAGSYGFNLSANGAGGKTYNAGSGGTAIGLSNNTSYTVLQLLNQVNLDIKNGTYSSAANAFNDIFSAINQTGDIN